MTRRLIAVSSLRIVVLALALILLLVVPAAAGPLSGPPGPEADPARLAKIEPQLLKEMARDGSATFVVYLREQADLKSLIARQAAQADMARPEGVNTLTDQDYRARARAAKLQQREAAVGLLRTTADRSQAGIRAFLDQQKGRGVRDYTPFWIFDGLAVTGDEAVLLALAARPDVEKIRANHIRQLAPPKLDTAPAAGPVVSWGLDKIHAPQVWHDLGVDGQGVVVASLDSGVDWLHPALHDRYRGADGHHDYNWFDATGTYPLAPADGDGHGTHTMGTMAGGTADNVIGVAPGARWIAVKGLSDQGSATDAMLHAGFQWLLAPTDLQGKNPDPSKAPDVVNNSWGYGPITDLTFMPDIDALRSAGIIPVFSIGNDGESGASTVGVPGAYTNVIGVGATDADDLIASFSSRGPGPTDQVKPQVSAPGVSVRSSLPNGEYGNVSGTSMAAPHVAGVIALLLQADPGLTYDDVEAFLRLTATDLGSAGPDDDYGWGRIDALRAVRWAVSAGRLHGRVAGDSPSGSAQPLPGAVLTGVRQGSGERFTTTAADDGAYQVAVPAGLYDVTATAFGYQPAVANAVQVISGYLSLTDFTLKPAARVPVTGEVVEGGTGRALRAEISVAGAGVQATAGADGKFELALPAGTYQITASAPRHRAQTLQATIPEGGAGVSLGFELASAPAVLLVEADAWSPPSLSPVVRDALTALGYAYTLRLIDDTAKLPSVADLQAYDVVIWDHLWLSPGWLDYQRKDTAATDTLRAYVAGGGRLLMMGQDIGYFDSGEGDSRYRLASSFYRQVLHGVYGTDAAGKDLTGVPGDIFDGTHLALGGPTAYRRGSELAGDGIRPADTAAVATITYDTTDSAGGLRAADGTSRLVYLAFSPEDAGAGQATQQLLDKAVTWLSQPGFAKSVDRAEAAPGSTLTYRLAVSNPSHAELTGWTLADPLPAQVEYLPGSLACAGTGCITPSYDAAQRTIRWSGALAASSSMTVTFQVGVANPLNGGTVFTNTATLADWRGQSLTAAAATTAVGPDLSASTKQASPAVVAPGDLLTYTLSLRSRTTSEAPGTRLVDPIPAGTTYVTGSVTGGAAYNAAAGQVEWTGTVPASGAPGAVYAWTDSDQPGGPAYDWVDIAATGTAITGLADDNNLGPFDIGFDFPFYGQAFNQFRVGSNGFLSFNSTSTAYRNDPLPSGGEPFNLLAVWWDDLVFSSDAHAYYWSNHADTLVVSFVDVPRLSIGGPYTFQVILKADGTITYQYKSMLGTRLDEATIGIQNGDGTAGVTVAYNQTYVHDALAVRFTPPDSGARPIAFSFQVRVNADAAPNSRIVNTASLVDSAGLTHTLAATSLVQPADLSASAKRVEPAAAEAGQPLRYTIDLRNTAASEAQHVTVTDVLPAEVTFVAGSAGDGASYDPATRRLTWSGSVPGNGRREITFQASVNPGTAAGSAITNTATIDDGVRPALRRSAVARVERVDLSASRKSVDRALANSGDELEYVITLANRGLVTATRVSLVDPLPQGTTYVADSATAGATYNPAGNRIEWQGDLPAYVGYSFLDNSRPGGPTFNWVDITQLGTAVPGLADDSISGPIDIGFDFPFYGRVFRNFYVDSNGFLTFSPADLAYFSNLALPDSEAPGNIVAMFWDDLTLASQGKVYTWTNHQDTLVVSYVGVPRLISGGPYTFQAILRRDGTIILQYLDMQGTRLNEATTGIQNADGSEGLTISNNDTYVHNNLAVLIRPPVIPEVHFRVRLGGDLPFETTVTNTATIDDGRGGTLQVSAATRANTLDLSGSTLAVDHQTARPGDTLTYRAELRNAGTASSTGQVVVPLPDHTTYIAGSTTGGASYDAGARRVVWTGRVTPGDAPAVFTFAVQLAAPLANATRVEAVATVDDGFHPAFSRSATTVVQAPDLSQSTKSADVPTAGVGDTLNYTLTVQNSGDAPAQATVTDVLPGNVIYVDGSARSTAGSAPVYEPAARRLVWRDTLPPRSRLLLTLSVRVSETGPIVNHATFDDGAGVVVERSTETQARTVDLVIPARRAAAGYVTSQDRLGNQFGVREIYAGEDTRPQTPIVMHGVFQFDLSQLPDDARIQDAQVELVGLDGRFLEPSVDGGWTLALLDSSVDLSWTRLGYWQIHNAGVDATSSPAVKSADLVVGKVNAFGLSGGVAALQARLKTTGRASFRIDGHADRAWGRQIFAWDGGAPPVLRVKYTLP